MGGGGRGRSSPDSGRSDRCETGTRAVSAGGSGRVLVLTCSPCSLPPRPESVMEPSSENMSMSFSQLP